MAGGAAGAAVVAGAGYGRFAVGDEFEEKVAEVLGVPTDVARTLAQAARERMGSPDYELAAAEFVAVTTFPTGQVAPQRALKRVTYRLLSNMIADSSENLTYLGLRAPSSGGACAGLLR